MKKEDIFSVVTPDGVEIQTIVLEIIDKSWEYGNAIKYKYLCYGQNKLFTCENLVTDITNDIFAKDRKYHDSTPKYLDVIANYVIIPRCDGMIERNKVKQ